MSIATAPFRTGDIGSGLSAGFVGEPVTFRLKHKDFGAIRYFCFPCSAFSSSFDFRASFAFCLCSFVICTGMVNPFGQSFTDGMVPGGTLQRLSVIQFSVSSSLLVGCCLLVNALPASQGSGWRHVIPSLGIRHSTFNPRRMGNR